MIRFYDFLLKNIDDVQSLVHFHITQHIYFYHIYPLSLFTGTADDAVATSDACGAVGNTVDLCHQLARICRSY